MRAAVTLLGPQRRPNVQHTLDGLDDSAVVATVTAGWQEREPDDAELAEVLGRRAVNLALHARWLDLLEQDREYGQAEREHDAALAELRQLYLVQLDHALSATYEVARHREGRPRLRDHALEDALEVVRLMDRQHLARIQETQHRFYEAWRPEERRAVATHRDEVRRILESSAAIVIAGGHVGDLVKVLHLFHVEPHLPDTVVAWSAGAMALTERVVLFHDYVPHGIAQTEVHGEGLGVVPDLVLLPHARRRLRADDPIRMAVLARRFSPSRCVVLDDRVRVVLGAEGTLPPDARVIAHDGHIGPLEAA